MAAKKATAKKPAEKQQPAEPQIVHEVAYVKFEYALDPATEDRWNYDTQNSSLKKSKLYRSGEDKIRLTTDCGDVYQFSVSKLRQVIDAAMTLDVMDKDTLDALHG